MRPHSTRWLVPVACAVAAVCALSADSPAPAEAAKQWPLWDGREPVERYARRVGLPPTRTLDLGGGVTMDFVLIPAGQFVMGTPDAVEPEEIFTVGQVLSVFAGGAALGLVIIIVLRSIHKRRRPQFSLGWLLVFVLMLGAALYGVIRCWQTEKAWRRYLAQSGSAPWFDRPSHLVTLTRPFYMGKYEVTQEQYEQVMQANPSQLKGRDNPVESVTWDDATAFCGKASAREQFSDATLQSAGLRHTVRLPTEAEWEFAARAGTTTLYHSGDTEADLARVAWYGGNSGGRVHPVGQKEPNAFGLYDMDGNVCEWCQDLYGRYSSAASSDPSGPTEGDDRVLRGGSWRGIPAGCRSANRGGYDPGLRQFVVGFRVVLDF